MRHLCTKLLDVEPLDVDALLKQSDPDLHELQVLRHVELQGVPLLDLAQRTLHAIREAPPVSLMAFPDEPAPWWNAMPSAYVAALFLHVGLGGLNKVRQKSHDGLPPHQRQSAKMSREILRRLDVPYPVREHAVALILNFRKPESLIGSGSPDETFMRLACRIDLRALYALKTADMKARPGPGDDERRDQVKRFRERAESIGVFGAPPPPPMRSEDIRRMAFTGRRDAHRAGNALQFFRLKTDESGRDWFIERLRTEKRSPRGRLHLLIGPAASGKTNWARHNLGHTTIVSSDRMREELTGDPSDQSQNYLVFQRCMTRIRHLLHEGHDVTFDATNYQEDLRDQPVQTARWCGAEINSYFMDIGLEEALDRNQKRSRKVPEKVIHRHYRLLTPPALYEADRHHFVDPRGRCHLYWPNGRKDGFHQKSPG